MKETRTCKECGKDFIPCHLTSEFCSKSCATAWRNKKKLENGTHNFNNIDRSKIAKDSVNNRTHPFLKGNMSEDALKKRLKEYLKLEKENQKTILILGSNLKIS